MNFICREIYAECVGMTVFHKNVKENEKRKSPFYLARLLMYLQ